MKKKIFSFICAFLILVPCCMMLSACEKPDDNTPPVSTPPTSTTPEVTLSSMNTEMVNVAFIEEYNATTKTFTIEYSDELPSVSDFEVTASFSDGSTSAIEDIYVMCPIEFYEGNLVVRDEPYKFEIVKNDASGETVVEFFVKIVKKKLTLPTAKTNQNFVYDGTEKVLEIIGFDNDVMTIADNAKINAGEYVATVSLKDTANYEWKNTDGTSIELEWVIDKKCVATADLPSVVGDYVYTGEPLNVVLNEKFDESCMSVENGTQITVGTYNVKIYLDDNHKFADETLESVGYYELEWVIEEPELEILVVDLSGYCIDDWTGTFNTVVGTDIKTICLSGLPEQVSVVYSHTKDGVKVTADELDTMATYITTAIITLKPEYAGAYVLPGEADVAYIPVISNARYESVEITENTIEISFTWKIYTREVDISSCCSWNGKTEYKVGECNDLPIVVLSKYDQAFSFEYVYLKYNETLSTYVEIDGMPSEVGKYKVSASIVNEMYFLTNTTVEDFEFEII